MLGAIGAGIQGFFQGKDWKEGREDRKRERERQERMDELVFAQDARDAEMHRLRVGEAEYQRSERQREAARQSFFDDMYRQADLNTQEAMAAANAGGVSATTNGTVPDLPPLPLGAVTPQRQGQQLITPAQRGMLDAASMGAAGPDIVQGGAGADRLKGDGTDRLKSDRADRMKGAAVDVPGMGQFIIAPNGAVISAQNGREVTSPQARDIILRTAAETAPRVPSGAPRQPTAPASPAGPPVMQQPPALPPGVPPQAADTAQPFVPSAPSLGAVPAAAASPARTQARPMAGTALQPTDGLTVFVPGAGDYILRPDGSVYSVSNERMVTDPSVRAMVVDLAQRQRAINPPAPSMLNDPSRLRPLAQEALARGRPLENMVGDAAAAAVAPPDPNRQFGQPGGAVGDAAEMVKRGIGYAGDRIAPAIQSAVQTGARGVDALNQGVSAALRYTTGADWQPAQLAADRPPPAPSQSPVDPMEARRLLSTVPQIAPPQGAVPAAAAPPPAALAPLTGTQGPTREAAARLAAPPVKPNATQGERAVAAAANQAVSQAVTPAMQAAADAAARNGDAGGVLGVPGGTRYGGMSEENVNRASKEYMDYYREHGAPMVIRALLEKGEIEKAMAFQEFLDNDATQRSMRDWARGATAAQLGDIDTAMDHFANAYNRMDYFGDGISVVREETGAIKDAQGNITGGRIVFRNEQTGDTFERVFDDPSDLIEFAVVGLSPEEAFKFYSSQIEAQREATLEATKAAQDQIREQEAAITSIAEQIFKAAAEQAVLNPAAAMTMAQARAQARAILEMEGAQAQPAAQAAPTGDIPVFRRPTE